VTDETATKTQILVARLAAALIVALGLLGLLWYGISTEVLERIWRDVLARPGGPVTFRFILQPAMAALAALRDGIRDARAGEVSYLWSILTDSAARGDRLREGWIATARIILLGLGMDMAYQLIVLDRFYPGEAVIVAILLAFIPYVLLRGPIARLARWRIARKAEAARRGKATS
jgi:hypothetical protein